MDNYLLYIIAGDLSTVEEELDEKEPITNEKEAISTLDDDVMPEPFDIEEHLSVVKANRQKRSTGNQE